MKRTKNKETMMAKVLVLYQSSCGHIETMSGAVAEGARSAGAVVDVRRVPELPRRQGRGQAGRPKGMPA